MKRLLPLVALLFFCLPAHGATWAHVNNCPPVSTGATPTATIPCTWAGNVTAGHLGVAYVFWANASSGVTLTSLIGTHSGTWTCLAPQYQSSVAMYTALCYICSMAGSGAETLTATVSSSASIYNRITAEEYSGNATSSCLRTSNQTLNTSGSTTPSAPSVTANAGDLVIGGVGEDVGVTITAGASYTLRGNDVAIAMEDQGISSGVSAGGYTTPFTFSVTSPWNIDDAIFKPAPAAGATFPAGGIATGP
jgi:hypothetical protein